MVYFLGIDVGTSSLKTGLWSVDGQLMARASSAYSTHRAMPTWAEQNPLDWWRALVETVQKVLHDSRVAPSEIAGIGVDSTGWTFVPINKTGDPLYPAMIWQDRRARVEAAALRDHPDAADIINLSASPLDEAYTTPKIQWLRVHHPDVYRQTYQFLISSGFVIYKLTGLLSCDYSQAYGFHCFDIRNTRWDAHIADLVGLDLEKLPPLYQACQVVGDTSQAAATELGLVAGIPVIAGGLDAAVGAFGSGVARKGTTSDQGGTAFGLSIAVDKVIVESRLIFSAHVVPGLYLLQGGTVGGGTFAWFREQFGQPERAAAELLRQDPYSIMTGEADDSVPGAHGLIFLPYMSGERSPLWNTDARGVFLGMSFDTKRSDFIRALMEGCVFAVYHNMLVAQEVGAYVTEWIGIGGAANSASWCQLKADITNRPFTVTRQANGEPGDNTLGLAVMAGFGTGHYKDLAETIERFLPERRVYQPDPTRHTIYQELFPIYLEAYERLVPTFQSLAKFTRN